MASIQSPTQRSTGASHRSTIQSSFSAESDSDSSNAVHVPSISRNGALPRIKSLLESVVDAINRGEELVIPYQTTRSPQSSQGSGAVERDGRQSDGVRFPGRTVQEAKKFEALFRILELSHEALLSGNLITKRNIYYQNPELFKSQSAVDDMVDNLAFTLGVGREDLNIVAAAKGLIAGPILLVLRDGSIHSSDLLSETGMLVPSVSSIRKIDFRSTRWLLVIEKEATFRTLAAAQYYRNSRAGHGILLTAKGFPDLATRRLLCLLQKVKPELAIFALVDYDPHGVAIMRTYKYGSQRLDHEEDATAPRLRWLGIRSDDILSNGHPDHNEDPESTGSQPSHNESPNQEAVACSSDGLQIERSAKRVRLSNVKTRSESVFPLTQRDRKKAVEIMKEIAVPGTGGVDELDQMQELQRMLMLNFKAEMQAVDSYGDIAEWLDGKLGG